MYGTAVGDYGITSKKHNEQKTSLTRGTAGRSDADDAGACSAD